MKYIKKVPSTQGTRNLVNRVMLWRPTKELSYILSPRNSLDGEDYWIISIGKSSLERKD